MNLFARGFSDGDRLEVAGAVVTLKVNPRARRVSLRLDRTRRQIVATAPSPRRLAEAADFARDRAAWIADRLAELPDAAPLRPGLSLEVFGQPVILDAGSGRARWIDADAWGPARITAMGEGEGFSRAVILQIRKRAMAVLGERTATYAAMLGAAEPGVAIMDAKSRWGSCRAGVRGAPGQIRYSWRLALAPFEVADYVAAHECVHLLEQNHGPKFWAHVRALVGDERRHRAWLREHGARLHAFGR
jgi:predicted metal-dependent hydrolase